MSRIIKTHHIITNSQEKGLSIKNWANIIAIYHSCGPGIHGKIEPTIDIKHKMIHIMQQTISIYFVIINCC
jgi:hypothetical protein